MTITNNYELHAETFTEDDAEVKDAKKESGVQCVGCGREFSIYASSFMTEDGGWVCPYCFYDSAQGWKLDPRWHTDPEFFGVVYQPRTRRRKEQPVNKARELSHFRITKSQFRECIKSEIRPRCMCV